MYQLLLVFRCLPVYVNMQNTGYRKSLNLLFKEVKALKIRV
ncbi:hypothetical protein HMPREF9151_01990 [Hoylesella saccharolytica F0055]|uniref:Uncharacterized protein n=1 Tax=Hoylesella saccharolytica F0055 TaxID=1127699 RepID=L1N5J8_9BACT|nr:hypothetical protein HMPREF9151_01990 [Hoylesella saccharolytica F0055]